MRMIAAFVLAILQAFVPLAVTAHANILESPNACAVPADVGGPGAAYEPGVDVDGRPVVPAEIDGPRLTGELRVPTERPSTIVNGALLKFLLGEFRVDLESGEVSTAGNLADALETAPADCPPIRR